MCFGICISSVICHYMFIHLFANKEQVLNFINLLKPHFGTRLYDRSEKSTTAAAVIVLWRELRGWAKLKQWAKRSLKALLIILWYSSLCISPIMLHICSMYYFITVNTDKLTILLYRLYMFHSHTCSHLCYLIQDCVGMFTHWLINIMYALPAYTLISLISE